MEKKSRVTFVLTFIFSTAAVAILSASMGTEYWIESFPTRIVDNNTEDGALNVTGGDPGSKFKGYVHFGLFHGSKRLDHGLGERGEEIWIPDEIADNALFSFGIWVSTVVFLALAVAMGLVSMAFSALNASSKPIETLTGPIGLYVWNGLAIVLTIITLALYVVLYFQDMKDNILSPTDKLLRWTSKDRTNLHYSFYFLLIAILLFGASILTVALAGVRLKPLRYGHNMGNKGMDGVMMY